MVTSLPVALQRYLTAIALAAVASLSGALSLDPDAWTALANHEALILLGGAALAGRFLVHLTTKTNIAPIGAITMATALLLSPAPAMIVIALGLSVGLFLARRNVIEAIFNVSQAVLCVGLGSAIFHLPVRSHPIDNAVLVAIVIALMFGLNTMLVAAAGALQTGADVFHAWWDGLWLDLPEEAAMLAVGLGVAFLLHRDPQLALPTLALIPLLALALRRRFALTTPSIEYPVS